MTAVIQRQLLRRSWISGSIHRFRHRRTASRYYACWSIPILSQSVPSTVSCLQALKCTSLLPILFYHTSFHDGISSTLIQLSHPYVTLYPHYIQNGDQYLIQNLLSPCLRHKSPNTGVYISSVVLYVFRNFISLAKKRTWIKCVLKTKWRRKYLDQRE